MACFSGFFFPLVRWELGKPKVRADSGKEVIRFSSALESVPPDEPSGPDIDETGFYQKSPDIFFLQGPEFQTVAEDILLVDRPELGVTGFPVMLRTVGADCKGTAGTKNANHLHNCFILVGE